MKDKTGKIIMIIIIVLNMLFVMGNIVMLICGALGVAGHLNINLAGSITMIVLGSLFGAVPFLRNLIKKD